MSSLILPFTMDHAETTGRVQNAGRVQYDAGSVRYDGKVSYFCEALGLNAVKIGTSSNLRRRLSKLQTGSAVPLVLLATTTMPERALHARFAADRIGGEWFRKSPALLALIDELKAEALAPANVPASVPGAVPPVTPDNSADKDFQTFAFGVIAAFLFPIAVACSILARPAAQETDVHTDVHEARVVVLSQQANPEKPVFRSASAQEVQNMSAGDFQDWASGVRKRLHNEAEQKFWHNGHPTSKTWLGLQN